MSFVYFKIRKCYSVVVPQLFKMSVVTCRVHPSVYQMLYFHVGSLLLITEF